MSSHKQVPPPPPLYHVRAVFTTSCTPVKYAYRSSSGVLDSICTNGLVSYASMAELSNEVAVAAAVARMVLYVAVIFLVAIWAVDL